MSGKPGIPSWQRAQPATSSPTSSPEQNPTTESTPNETPATTAEESHETGASQTERSSLLEQAERFLDDPSIRDAPREKKIAFLQSKGVATENIEAILGARELETETGTEIAASSTTQEEESAWPTPPPPRPSPPPSTKPQVRDIPPIVTYPEFLTPSTKPPPLITTRRLLNTAYVAGGVAATMYGLARYIIAPMTVNLAESRHDFAAHTKEKLDEMNTRLGEVVSEDPAQKPKSKIVDIVDDISEADSDPTELFHRDIGTQTTPNLSRRPSVSTASDADKSVVTGHEKRLKIISSHLRELEASRSNDTASSDSLKTKLSDLTTYLHDMSYQNQYYSGMGGIYGGSYGVPKTKDGKDDQIEVLKADIRAVKGVLLSARNFPTGGPRTAGKVGA